MILLRNILNFSFKNSLQTILNFIIKGFYYKLALLICLKRIRNAIISKVS